jgi:diguanylate cyclase (GGDEF)-like protein/PAS domain S-box-containing protein
MPFVSINDSRVSLRRKAAFFSVAILLTSICFIAIGIWREVELRGVELKSAEVEAGNLSRSIIQHIDDTVEIANTVLQGIARRLETEGVGAGAIADLQGFINLRKASNSRLRGIFVYDENGNWLATSERVDLSQFNNSDREYFQHHKTSADNSVYIGRPIKSRSGGQWILPISRRVNRSDGSFGGVVLATVDVAYFEEFFRSFNIGPRGAIALIGDNRVMLARIPRDERTLGQAISSAGDTGTPEDVRNFVVIAKSPIDGMERITSFQRSLRHPIYIVVAMATADVLGSWKRDALARMALTLLLVVLAGGLALFSVMRSVERYNMMAALKATEEEFRLLAEWSSDMVSRVRSDGTIVYISPSSSDVLGWSPSELIGRDALAGTDPADRAAVVEAVERLLSGAVESATISYPNRRKSGAPVWLESSLRSTRSRETGAVDGFVAVTRDITSHKARERELADLADSDGLTTLANRRAFDARLENEWSRAQRECSDLSLILADVDHFKSYNDTYGHQAGDACLKAVAGVLAAECQRPADLVARYGGEEFVVLLPATDLAGACEVAERMAEAVRGLALPHSRSLTRSTVTVSFGIATSTPVPGGKLKPGQLFAYADRALYEAKAAGRDRIKFSEPLLEVAASGQTLLF